MRVWGMWKRIIPSRSTSEQLLRHCLRVRTGSDAHFPAAARSAQSGRWSPIASQRNALEHVTVSVWFAQILWMWHDARQTVSAFLGSVVQPPLSAKLTHVSDVSCRIESLSDANLVHEALHCWSMKAGLR